jgi:lysophospholipase L1-like esterase
MDIGAERPAGRYVALGDSYTIGEGVLAVESWPALLAAHLRQAGVPIEVVANPSVTGWTSAELIEHELPVLQASDATFVTVMIGVNDWVQGVPEEEFRRNLGDILDCVQAVLADPDRVLLITIPDFSVTPEGARYARGRDITAGLAAFNAVIEGEAEARGIPCVDVFPLSRELRGPEFVAADGLHPSGAAYLRWTERIFPVALSLLTGQQRD